MKKKIKLGNIYIGGDQPITIQSMTNTDTNDIEKTVQQIHRLEECGCQIVRVSVKDDISAKKLSEIKSRINIPLVADIHFDYKLAILSIENGADKIRINPGNISNEENLKKIIDCAKTHKIPIRIGVNSGSLDKKYKICNSDSLVDSMLENIKIFEKYKFYDLVLSLKSSDVKTSYDAYTKISKLVDYPLHLGITEAGTFLQGTVKSSIGLGALLLNVIGDTIRVSLTDDPVKEVEVAKQILKALNLKRGVTIISCPTCGRCEIDLINLARRVEKEFQDIDLDIKIAVMGCVVNGPGEAKEADFGIAGGKKEGIIFKKGKIIKKVREENLFDELKCMIFEDIKLPNDAIKKRRQK